MHTSRVYEVRVLLQYSVGKVCLEMGLKGLRGGGNSVMNNESSRSRGELRFKKKIEFYAKVKDTVSALTAEKAIKKKKKKLRSRQKKLRVYDLSSLSEFLPQLKAPSAANATARTSLKLNSSRSRQKLLEKEEKQLKGVLNHSAFQLDPLASIHQHLKSTQPVPPVQKPKNKFTKTGKRTKGKKSKASFEPQPIDCLCIHLSHTCTLGPSKNDILDHV